MDKSAESNRSFIQRWAAWAASVTTILTLVFLLFPNLKPQKTASGAQPTEERESPSLINTERAPRPEPGEVSPPRARKNEARANRESGSSVDEVRQEYRRLDRDIKSFGVTAMLSRYAQDCDFSTGVGKERDPEGGGGLDQGDNPAGRLDQRSERLTHD